jgi:hypothetical protein
MIDGLEKVKGHRTWLVPDFVVWGLPVWAEIELLAVEKAGSVSSVFYGAPEIGDPSQQVAFSDLSDHRGNQLPASISSPLVLVRPTSQDTAFVISGETDTTFKIARDPEASGPVTVDLMVLEIGD